MLLTEDVKVTDWPKHGIPLQSRKAPPSAPTLISLARICGKISFEFTGRAVELLGIRQGIALNCHIRPGSRKVKVKLKPFFQPRLRVRLDGLGRTFRLANAAVDAFIRMDHKHILALVEAIHGANFDAIHIFALDAIFRDDISHGEFPILWWAC